MNNVYNEEKEFVINSASKNKIVRFEDVREGDYKYFLKEFYNGEIDLIFPKNKKINNILNGCNGSEILKSFKLVQSDLGNNKYKELIFNNS